MRLLPLLAMVAFASPSAALAQDAASEAEAPAAKSDKPVCKTTSTTGSRLRKTRYCMSAWEAKVDADKAKRDVNEMRRRDIFTPPAGPF